MYYVLCGINALHYFWYLQLILARSSEPRYSNTPSDFFSIFKFENEVNRVHQVVSCLPMDSAAV